MVGVTLVLKRFSFIGDGLSHVAFGAMTVGTILHVSSNLYVTMPITILAAILLLRGSQNSKVMGDAKLAILSVVSLAFGYLMMNVFSSSANVSGDVCTTLFGSTSILTLTTEDVILCLVISAIVIVSFVFLYNRLFAVTFDEEYAKATGTKTETYNLIIAIIIAVIIVLGMNLVGSLLISALIIFPIGNVRIWKLQSSNHLLYNPINSCGLDRNVHINPRRNSSRSNDCNGRCNYVSYIYTPRQSDC